MQLLKQLRNHLGISQDALADWLSISRPYLVKVEKGSCSLNTYSYTQLETLHACLQQVINEGYVRELVLVENPDLIKAYARRLKNCRWYLALNQRRLEEMKEAHDAGQKLQRVLARLKQTAPERDAWISLQEQKLALKMASCHEAAQAPVKKQVHLLMAEVAYLSAIPGLNAR